MNELWAMIETKRSGPRLIVTNQGKEPLLKARMRQPPQHPRALTTLLEGVALWEGAPIRAALVAGARDSYDISRYHDCFAEPGTSPLFTLAVVPTLAEAREHHRDSLRGMGKFDDLRQLMLFEVAK